MHLPLTDRSVMGTGQVDANRNAISTCVKGGSDRAQGFGQDGAGPPVQEPVWLSIALHRHGARDCTRFHLGHLCGLHHRNRIRG